MAVDSVTLINLFFVPLISLAIAYARKGEKPKCTTSFWIYYGCYAAILVPIIKVMANLAEKLIDQPVELYSGYYTIVGILCAVLLPYIAEILRKIFNVKCKIEKKENAEKVSQ